MKAQTAAERAVKAAVHFRKEIAGSLSVQAETFAESIARTAQYYADEDDWCVIARPSDGNPQAVSCYGSVERIFPDGEKGLRTLLKDTDFRFSDHNDGTLFGKEYRAWMSLPVTGKRETHLAVVIARKNGKFSSDEKNAGKGLSSYLSMALKDVKIRNRKASAMADEAEHRILLRTQQGIGRKQQPFPGFFQISDYSARTGSDAGQMWPTGDEGIVACVYDVTADNAERQTGLVYIDTWFAILAQTSLDMQGILQRLNADMARQNRECYASIAGLRYSKKTGQVQIAGAGNASAFFFDHETMSVTVVQFGAAAGIRKDIEVRTRAFLAKSGDIVCLCTDGLTTAQKSNGELVGTEAVAELIRRHYFLSAEDLAAKILETVTGSAAAGINPDDRTLQVLKTV